MEARTTKYRTPLQFANPTLWVINPYQDRLDSEEIIARINELESQDDLCSDDEYDELRALLDLAEQGETLDDWEYGLQLIRDTDFEDYAQELAEDIGAIPETTSWPARCIDWEQAARELQMDYTPLEFAGVTYWAR